MISQIFSVRRTNVYFNLWKVLHSIFHFHNITESKLKQPLNNNTEPYYRSNLKISSLKRWPSINKNVFINRIRLICLTKIFSMNFPLFGYGPVNSYVQKQLLEPVSNFYFVRSWMYDGLQVSKRKLFLFD